MTLPQGAPTPRRAPIPLNHFGGEGQSTSRNACATGGASRAPPRQRRTTRQKRPGGRTSPHSPGECACNRPLPSRAVSTKCELCRESRARGHTHPFCFSTATACVKHASGPFPPKSHRQRARHERPQLRHHPRHLTLFRQSLPQSAILAFLNLSGSGLPPPITVVIAR